MADAIGSNKTYRNLQNQTCYNLPLNRRSRLCSFFYFLLVHKIPDFIHVKAPTHHNDSRDCSKRDRRGMSWKIADKLVQRRSMSHQKDCYRLRVVSCSSDTSGDRVGLLVGVLEAILRHYDRVEDMSYRKDRLRLRPLRLNMLSLDDSFSETGINEIIVVVVASQHQLFKIIVTA